MAALAGKLSARRQDCAPLAGKSTLHRLERGGPELTRYHRIAWDGAKIEALFVDLFVEAHQHPPRQIILDLDATDDPLHGHQEGRFFEVGTDDSGDIAGHRLYERPEWAPVGGGARSRPAAGSRSGADRRGRLVAQPAGVQDGRAQLFRADAPVTLGLDRSGIVVAIGSAVQANRRRCRGGDGGLK